MTREQLLRAVGDIRDTFIREAAPPPASYRKRREFPWAGAVAACLALVIVGSTFFLSQLGMGSGDTSANDTASAAGDATENATAGESGGGMDVAADGADEAAPENAAPMVTVDGTVYVLADSGGPWPETCPAGLVQAGEAELPDTGERCPCFAPPEDTGEIWVYQTCRDPETGTAYKGYVRYVAETPD